MHLTYQTRLPLILLCTAALTGLVACDIEQTEEGAMPDVDVAGGKMPDVDIDVEAGRLPDVDVTAGKMPKWDVDWADVNVGTTEETVTVPKLRVVMEEETVTVPVIDVDMPDDDDDAARVRRTIRAAVQVPGDGYDVQIRKIYVHDDELVVVSQLTGRGATGDRQIVSDNVVINAPDMDVRHVVIGARPAGAYNEQHRFVDTEADLDIDMDDARLIYDRSGTRAGR